MKQKNLIGWAYLLTWVLAAPACRQTPQEISLAGEWQFALDPKGVGLKEEWQGQPTNIIQAQHGISGK